MPIKIPKVESSRSLAGGGSPQLGVPSVPSTAPEVGREIEQVAEALRKREVEMEIQHDNAVAQSTYTKFRDEANAKLRNYLDLEGADVDGSQAEYTKWYDERLGKVSAGLGSRRQQELFGNSAASSRFADLNSLSAHQSKELKRFKDKTADSRYASAKNSVELHAGDSEFIEEEIKEVAKAINNANPGVDNSLDISNKAAALYLIDIQTLAKSDPAKAKIMLEARRGQLAGNYEKAKDVVDREYVYALAKSRYRNSYTDQINFINEMGEDIIGAASKAAAISRIRIERDEEKHQQEAEYAAGLKEHRNTVNDLILQGKFSAALDQNRGAVGIESTDRRILDDIIKSHAKAGNTGTIFSEYDADYVKEILAEAEKGVVPSGPVPGKLDTTHYKLGVFVAEHANKEARGELKPLESRAYTAVKSIVKGLELDDPREEALMTGRKMNELGEYIKANPGADYMKYIDEQLMPEEKGWAIVNWIKKTASGPVGEFIGMGLPGAAPRKIYDRIFGTEEPSSRERAISTLEDAGKPITERNIEYVIQNAD